MIITWSGKVPCACQDGNGDARVLVKPYKEKGKVPDKYRKHQQQQMERGEFSVCGSPTGLDSRDPYDLPLGRRLMGLQLLDVKRHNHHRTLSTGAAIPSPINSPNFFDQTFVLPSDRSSSEVTDENGSNPAMAASATVVADQLQHGANVTEKEREPSNCNDENGNAKKAPIMKKVIQIGRGERES
ncbi:hypothetical protein F0562_003788 [Nyssa sinensis]|uniref:Uncharacterized protein n=1 Tax=Nyssa sinensis TaxID=561372 RepID=A0A5J5BWV7_9ASTE|nr:hypothetical protein F0562_003788 [Nyssa sinensis]